MGRCLGLAAENTVLMLPPLGVSGPAEVARPWPWPRPGTSTGDGRFAADKAVPRLDPTIVLRAVPRGGAKG